MDEKSRQIATNRIAGALKSEMRKVLGKSCLLCQDQATNAHVWVPTPEDIVRHGGGASTLRAYVYGVCDRHDPNQLHLFESKQIIARKVDSKIREKLGQ